MKKLADIRGEEALDVLVDLLEPATEIMADPAVKALARSGKKLEAVKTAIRNHKQSVITILAVLENENPETYQPPLTMLPIKLLELLNDKDLVQLFQSQDQKENGSVSGSATETTAAHATE